MKATIELENTDELEATISLTMRIRDWKALREQMSNEYPSWKLSGLINTLTYKAEKQILEKTEETP